MRWAKLLIVVFVAGCASQAPGTRPDAMSASEHRAHARAHESAAEQHQAQYDPDAEVRQSGSPTTSEFEYDIKTYNPTASHRYKAEDEREIAREHRTAARTLESYTAAECAEFPPATRPVCPLLTVVTREDDVPHGARLVLADGVPPKAVLDHMRCHHAFARENGYSGMPACPLYLEKVQMSLAPDEKSILITSDDAATVKEIRRRARAHVAK